MPYPHIPVMLREVMEHLNCRSGKIYVDGTLGGAGHAQGILDRIRPGGMLIGCDQDVDAIENARKVLTPYIADVRLFHGNFVQISEFLGQLRIGGVDGILLDLGLSLHLIKFSGRGFSFQKDEPLDMRMNTSTQTTAADLVNRETEGGLVKIFKTYGEERQAKRIARKIVSARARNRIQTSAQLARIVCEALPARTVSHGRIHPATRVFMALRIAVNRELERLEQFMDTAADLLNPTGTLCILSYHSLEDRIVKHRMKQLAEPCTCPPEVPKCACGRKPTVRILTRKAVQAAAEEIRKNPMARSARLRAMEKLAGVA